MKKQNDELARHVFNFSPRENGGESLLLTTIFRDNGDYAAGIEHGVFLNQELTLCSYGNSASFNLCGINLTPKNLRKLADELEAIENSFQPTLAMKR
jgi:hypothetical protein